MTTGGDTTNASNLTIETSGTSSAAMIKVSIQLLISL